MFSWSHVKTEATKYVLDAADSQLLFYIETSYKVYHKVYWDFKRKYIESTTQLCQMLIMLILCSIIANL